MGLTSLPTVCWSACLLTFLVGSHGVLGQFSAPAINCLPPGAQSLGTAPDLPDIPDSFRVKVELTVEGRNYTEQADEIFDSANNRAAIRWLNKGVETLIIFSYTTNEVFHITDMNCTVRNMSSDFFTNLLGTPSYKDGRTTPPSGASALYFGDDIVKIYLGKKEVRGVMCDHWRACVGWAAAGENFTIDYYFSAPDWGTPSTYPQVPIRYELNGTQVRGGSTRNFHRVYDFFDFMMDADADQTAFETPRGVVCPGRKVTRKLPDMTSHSYHFREEIVNMGYAQITQADVWYALDQKLVRVDYRPPPSGSGNDPVSEVHDFNYGISYVRNLLTGECTPQALQQKSFDAKLNTVAYLKNGSYVLHMRNPLSFFFLDSNFTYSGQRYARDALCDVFISHRNDYDFYDNGTLYEAKVETYFLAEAIEDIPNDAMQAYASRFPFRCELWLPSFGIDLVYNIFDFDTERPEISLFNIADCYKDSQKLDFKVKLLGRYRRDTEHMVLLKGQDTMAQIMAVSPLRVTNVRLDYDQNFVYLIATLLGPSPSLGQFTHIPKTTMEHNDDLFFADVPNPGACSSLCVTNTDFVCRSFQYCPNDHNACGLSKRHISDGGVNLINSTCDLYSRTVDTYATRPEVSIEDAYGNLLQSIQMNTFTFDIPEDDGSSTMYLAVASEIVFGYSEYVDVPKLPSQFSYRMEIVFPRQNFVQTYDVWYDSTSKLVRYDSRDVLAGPPYYSPYTIKSIHDFNTGVAYNIDTRQGNCTPGHIPTRGGFDTLTLNSSLANQGIVMAVMKSPMQLFYLDNSTYTFTGQKTVRGILCDVYESVRTDFKIADTGNNGTQHSVFQFYFQSSSWNYVADNHDDNTRREPVMLVVLDAEANQYLIYNFYDFNDEHIAFDQFDISPCFDDDQRIDFVMDFNKTYSPYLDTREWRFRTEVQMLISSELRISPLRVQNIQVTYNMDQTFVIGTLLGEVDPGLHFVEDGTVQPYSASVSSPGSDVSGCAAFCYYSRDIVCNSYDICPDGLCLLSTKHVPDGPVRGTGGPACRHFSRVVNGTLPSPSLTDAYVGLKDLVYKGLFVVVVPLSGDDGGPVSNLSPLITGVPGAPVDHVKATYLATGIRSDILRQAPPAGTGGANLKHFSLFKSQAQMKGNSLTLAGMAVDECATACLAEDMFECQAFQYCYTTGDCFLNQNYPAPNSVNMSRNVFCDVYGRLYSDSYIKYPGQILESASDDPVKAPSLELCAKQCTVSTSINCLSFDYCPSNDDCLLRQVHILDTNPKSIINSSTCTHYSKNYLSDFSVKPHKILPGRDNMRRVMETDPVKCAKLCREQGGCLSFEFCQSECHLSSASGIMDSSVTDSSTCDLYILKDSAPSVVTKSVLPTKPPTTAPPAGQSTVKPPASATPGQPTNRPTGGGVTVRPSNRRTFGPVPVTNNPVCPPNQSQQGSGGSSDDTGPRVGIAFGMLVLGLLLGTILMFVIQRFRNKDVDDSNLELMPTRPSYS